MNYRPVYTDSLDNCLWFDENGYWRQGNCQNVGTSGNSKRISQRDLDCPFTKIIERDGRTLRLPAYWTDSNGNRVGLTTVSDRQLAFESNGVPTNHGSSTSRVDYTVRNGRYKQSCIWRFIRRRWKCCKRKQGRCF